VKLHALALALTSLGAQAVPPPQPYAVVRCAPAKGINLTAVPSSDRPKDAAPEVFEQASGGYVTHPASTHAFLYTINEDGSATETMLLGGGRSVINQMHIVGKLDRKAMSFTVGGSGNVTLISFYPNESLVIVTLAGMVGDTKRIPVGSVYLSRCTFSW
jgi:hypothetical protein